MFGPLLALGAFLGLFILLIEDVSKIESAASPTSGTVGPMLAGGLVLFGMLAVVTLAIGGTVIFGRGRSPGRLIGRRR